eukprot:COSAG03_NODE_5183_length_1322_cov_5.209321_2_plen_32_part_00
MRELTVPEAEPTPGVGLLRAVWTLAVGDGEL